MVPKNTVLRAHLMALVTILIWGTSFVATKVLLRAYAPVQIMLMRFALAYVVLWILRPKFLKVGLKTELSFLLLGLFGCTVYFLAENYALSYTLASNVSILVATAPVLTAILSHFAPNGERLTKYAFYGFFIAIFGVALVVFNGSVVLRLNPLGDLLSVAAALSWAIYGVLLKKYVKCFDIILLTRRLMFWGFVTSLPIALTERVPFSFQPLTSPVMLFCILFLGIICSGACYVLWNRATRHLGTVIVNNYVYLNPFSTMLAAGIFLREPISWMGICGAILILLGVFVSDRRESAEKTK